MSKKRPNGYWGDKERCREEASKYSSRAEFSKGTGSAYNYARAAGWLDEFFGTRANLSKLYPELRAEFSELNRIDFDSLSFGSTVVVLWECIEQGHLWEASPNSRTNDKSSCPECAMQRRSLATKAPHLEAEYHPTKNTTPFSLVSFGSNDKVWWICSRGHVYDMAPRARMRGQGCSFCSRQRVSELNSIAVHFPHLEAEYHQTKNTIPFAQVSYGSDIKVWWNCSLNHVYDMAPGPRVNGHGCPFCSRQRVSELNSLVTKAPHLEAEYHPTKNTVPFSQVSYGSNDKVWWICSRGHVYDMAPYTRVLQGCGCSFCSGKRVSEVNSLAVIAPHLTSQWSARNQVNFEDIAAGSHENYWWKCSEAHEWEASPHDRTRKGGGTGCSLCANAHTKTEQSLERMFDVERWNRYIFATRDELPYRPDVKLSDTVYANADGLYWHSVQNKPADYHFKMREAFEGKGLRLLQFYEDEINQKPRIVRSMVDAVLGKTTNRIMARKCSIQGVVQAEAQEFLQQNHIIGRVGWGCSFVGLHFDDKLVQLLAIKKQGDMLEIVRSCGKIDTIVTGGFQRLLRYVVKVHAPRQVKTLIDLRYADGHSLVKAGFKLQKIAINYEYTNNRTRKDKRTFRVKAGIDEAKTAAERGWYRIYNAGRARYILDMVY